MKYLKILLPLIIFIIIGSIGDYTLAYIQTDNTIYYWFTIPAFILGIYYAFALTAEHPKSQGGRIPLIRIVLTIIIFAFSYRSMNGYVIYSNRYLGQQSERLVTGKITEIHIRNRKLVFDKSKIDIQPDGSFENISFEVPGYDYSVGQVFSKKMIVGSLGILYSPE